MTAMQSRVPPSHLWRGSAEPCVNEVTKVPVLAVFNNALYPFTLRNLASSSPSGQGTKRQTARLTKLMNREHAKIKTIPHSETVVILLIHVESHCAVLTVRSTSAYRVKVSVKSDNNISRLLWHTQFCFCHFQENVYNCVHYQSRSCARCYVHERQKHRSNSQALKPVTTA